MKLNELEDFPELGNTIVIDGIEYVKEMFAGQLYSDGYNNRKLDNACLRDHFAGLAMQGLLSSDKDAKWDEDDIALIAYGQADAMLERRGKE